LGGQLLGQQTDVFDYAYKTERVLRKDEKENLLIESKEMARKQENQYWNDQKIEDLNGEYPLIKDASSDNEEEDLLKGSGDSIFKPA